MAEGVGDEGGEGDEEELADGGDVVFLGFVAHGLAPV